MVCVAVWLSVESVLPPPPVVVVVSVGSGTGDTNGGGAGACARVVAPLAGISRVEA
jgi:hypothetical protein